MIFSAGGSQLIDIKEEKDEMSFTWGQDVGWHRNMVYQLREHDPQNGMSEGRHFQHVASMDEITFGRLLVEQPEVLKDSKALHKWLQTPLGQECKIARDPKPIKGDGLQIIVK